MSVTHLNQVELAARWKISPRTLERWRWTGDGPAFIKIGGRVVYRLEDVETYERTQLRASTADTRGGGIHRIRSSLRSAHPSPGPLDESVHGTGEPGHQPGRATGSVAAVSVPGRRPWGAVPLSKAGRGAVSEASGGTSVAFPGWDSSDGGAEVRGRNPGHGRGWRRQIAVSTEHGPGRSMARPLNDSGDDGDAGHGRAVTGPGDRQGIG